MVLSAHTCSTSRCPELQAAEREARVLDQMIRAQVGGTLTGRRTTALKQIALSNIRSACYNSQSHREVEIEEKLKSALNAETVKVEDMSGTLKLGNWFWSGSKIMTSGKHLRACPDLYSRIYEKFIWRTEIREIPPCYLR